MMSVIYNLLQLLGLALLWPLLILLAAGRAKYRRRIPARLGLGLRALAATIPAGRPRIWVHALSVGEAASAVPLVRAIRDHFPGAVLLFSAATASGERYARSVPGLPVDRFLPFPLDIYPVAERFVQRVRPDLFILVETDFWPNFLHRLAAAKVPALLVNGRISQKSYSKYSFLQPFFLPMFRSFTALAMQREEDVARMVRLGVAAAKVRNLGNLKYDAMIPQGPSRQGGREEHGLPLARTILIAGSTHEGEEEMVCRVFQALLVDFPDLYLVLAPRNIERGPAVLRLARQLGLAAASRSGGGPAGGQVLVLDTMGELAGLYRLADMAFVGGSLVAAGGHNPLEPAAAGIPVLFGPFMEDFADVVDDMLTSGCATQVRGEEELAARLRFCLADAAARKRQGEAARQFVAVRQGVSLRHVELIRQVLS
jgi:3-deoxy-D-manno-octulosonic-acid transferase